MTKWLRRIRGALLIGVTWALVWLPLGLLLGMILDPDGTMDEPWLLVGTIPGFLAGVAFSVVLAIAARKRGFRELSLRRFTAWGAIAGLIIGTLPFVLGDQGPNAQRVWLLPLVVISSITLMGAASAAATLAIARRAEGRELPDGSDKAEPMLTRGAAEEVGIGRREKSRTRNSL